MAALDVVTAALKQHGSRQVGKAWTCPTHEDSTPSLGVTEGRDGRVLLRCRAGCETEKILLKIGLTMSHLLQRVVAGRISDADCDL
ncbi:MAG: hypothetical protein U0527_07260 [Candidatus Eisenbacteria bacterium]